MPDNDLRILLIEADPALREAVHRSLDGKYSVTDAETATGAREILPRSSPDCVFVDADLPDGDALQLVAEINALSAGLPVIALTNPGDSAFERAARAVGVHECVPKNEATPERLRQAVALVESLSTLRSELAETRLEMQHLASSIAHEFRAPLRRVIEWGKELAAGEIAAGSPESDPTEIVESAEKLSRQIDRLLEYSMVGQRPVTHAAVDLNTIVRSSLEAHLDLVREKNAQIESEHLPTVWGDGKLLRQLFHNLLGNAIKFHGKGSPMIRIGARLKRGEWEISVQDNGIGIEADHQSTIFAPFTRLQAAGHGGQYGGVGLGLATCRRIAQVHGGRIRVFSEPGRGSIFRCTLPAPPADAPTG